MTQEAPSAAAARADQRALSTEAQCAGRESELARLTALYREAQRAHSVGSEPAARLVLVEGPSGVGKSRLLGELRSRVRLQGGVVLEGRCDPGRAFGPFAEIVDRALRFLDEVGVAPEVDLDGLACFAGCHRLWHQHAAGTGHVSDDLADSSSALASLAGTTPETAVFEKRLRFFDAIAGLLHEVARVRAPLIVLDHLEKADRGTLDLLSFLLESTSFVDQPLRALFVGSLRCGDGVTIPQNVAALRAHERATRVEIGVLDLDGVRAYLSSQRAIARILERTGGMPEAIDLLLEGQPLTPELRVRRRLEALPVAAASLVEALAVLARPTEMDQLARVAAVEPAPADRAAFAACDLLTRTVVEGRILFYFDREADAERTYALLPPHVQVEIHRRCMEAAATANDIEEAVRHALSAGALERASELAVAAAASLSARHAHAEAAALLESFLARFGDNAPAAVLGELAELYRVTGEYARALVHARAVLDRQPNEAAAAYRVGQLLTAAGDYEAAARVLASARELAELHDPSVLADVEAQLAELYYQSADWPAAASWAQRALEAAQKSQQLVIELQARNTLGKLALAQKDAATASALFVENRDKASAAGLGHQEAQAHTNYAVALLIQRDLRAAERACHTAVEVATRVSDTRERAIATENLAVIAHYGRRYDEALGYYHHAVGLLKRLGNRAMLARVANNLGELYLTLGERGRARAMCDFASRIGGKLPGSVLGESLLLEGRIDAEDGNVSSARRAFERALETFTRLGDVRRTEAAIELARMALFDGDVALARSILSELPIEMPAKHRADLALVSAELERAAGGDTRATARRAVELADACDDPERLLVALVRHARALGDANEVGLATRVLERAQKIEEELTARVPEESRAAWAERPHRAELTRIAAALATAWTRTRHESVPPPRALTGTHRAARSAPDHDARLGGWRAKYPCLVGSSDALTAVFGVLDKVCQSDALVLVRGESGTGKELIADAVHKNSPRKNKPLVKVNCAALVETLLLSELFGHERGAFTGANARKKGRFELADGGTIFLDEIGDISPKTQVALLRVLQEREFERVGGTQPIKVDVRIIAATHRDLEQMVKDGTFREDLYYRLRGVTVEMPPLRERIEDVGALSDYLLGQIALERGEPRKQLSPEALACLSDHRWPGNVRELENILRSATLFADGPVLVPDDFAAFAESFQPIERAPRAPAPAHHAESAASDGRAIESLVYEQIRGGKTSLFEMKKAMERECIQRALDDSEGNITRAAALLGMKRPRLSQLVKQYGLKGVE